MKYSDSNRKYIIEKNGEGKYRVRCAKYLLWFINYYNYFLIRERYSSAYSSTTYRFGEYCGFDFSSEQEAQEAVNAYFKEKEDYKQRIKKRYDVVEKKII